MLHLLGPSQKKAQTPDLQPSTYPYWVCEVQGNHLLSVTTGKAGHRFMRNSSDLTRTVSRHTLAYILYSVSEMLRHYTEFDPLDLLIVHAVLNANVINVMNDLTLDERFSGIDAVEPDTIKLGGFAGRAVPFPELAAGDGAPPRHAPEAPRGSRGDQVRPDRIGGERIQVRQQP
ncbi:hypothetical protein [Bradyrhizobium guangdongense]|uniref:hypothetical protein n=1 Tax=Bradyrhizobium guangdongense TaxID=1325090 RepID=UPI001FED6C38|nr:hypothetical protein [Bradyrhizobium guangdongense]